MLKSINKKIVPLLFVIAALTRFASTMPMDPCEQPPKESFIKRLLCCLSCSIFHTTRKKITDIPHDCLGEIFQFFAESNNPKATIALRLVCRDFKETIEKNPCFFMKRTMRYFPNNYCYLLYFTDRLGVEYKNPPEVESSIDDCSYSFVGMKDLPHVVDQDTLAKLMNPNYYSQYKKSHHNVENGINYKFEKVPCIKIYDKSGLAELVNKNSSFLDILKREGATATVEKSPWLKPHLQIDISWEKDRGKTVCFNGYSFSNENLAMVSDIQNIKITVSEKTFDAEKKISWPKSLQHLSLYDRENFDVTNLENLKRSKNFDVTNLENLNLSSFHYEYEIKHRFKEQLRSNFSTRSDIVVTSKIKSLFTLDCSAFRGNEFKKIGYDVIRRFIGHKLDERPFWCGHQKDLNSLKQFLASCTKGKITTRNETTKYPTEHNGYNGCKKYHDTRLEKKKEVGKVTYRTNSSISNDWSEWPK